MAGPTSFDSNVFYRITNPSIGSNFWLLERDSRDPTGVPIGTVDVTPSGPFMGQLWQLLNLDNAKGSSTYLLSSYYLGAQKKLFVTVGADAIYIPFLTNFTNSPYDLSWIVSPSGYSSAGSANVTFSISPTFLGGSQVLSVNTITKQPFLEAAGKSNNQQWQFTPVQHINDPSFSAAALSAVGTSATKQTATINSNPPTHTAATTAASTLGTSSSFSDTSTNSQSTTFTPHGALLAAIIATPMILFVALLTLGILLISWRRKALKRGISITGRRIGYPSQQTLVTPAFNIYRPPPSSRRIRSTYTASLASSSEYVQSSHPGFHSLLPSPPRRGSREQDEKGDSNHPPHFFGSSALGDHEARPVSPLTPSIRVKSLEGVELDSGSVIIPKPTHQEDMLTRPQSPASIYEPRRMDSPLSSMASMQDFENQTQTGLTVSKEKRRPTSLISRWLL
ncbi:hypothetical protein N431DRAFT_565026 [Stipitochalara longipes BDJ]|nr:hypothetical protein N431DRAFT_565026 [Stipitochalara longipes BDJ]